MIEQFDLEPWTVPPEPFRTGECPHCSQDISPKFTQIMVETERYSGPVVVLIYVTMEGNFRVVINGELMTCKSQAEARTEELFGADADDVMRIVFRQLHEPSEPN